MCRSVDQPILISASFAESCAKERRAFASVGRFALRGVGKPQELFTRSCISGLVGRLTPAAAHGGVEAATNRGRGRFSRSSWRSLMSSDERFPYSRPAIVGVGSMGLVTAAAPAFAQSSKEAPLSKHSETPAPEGLQDPRSKYPKPPFRRQEQPWPGLASRMDPRPDHGETSYRGSGRLAGRKALVTGGDSGMGRASSPFRRASEERGRGDQSSSVRAGGRARGY